MAHCAPLCVYFNQRQKFRQLPANVNEIMPKYFIFSFVDENIVARARLFDEAAPKTVALLWGLAPFEGDAGHAMFSGTSCALYIDSTIIPPRENATTLIQTGDLMFTHYDALERHGFPDPLSEIYWAYDRYCRPTMPGSMLTVCPNIFGRFEGDFEAFFQASRDIRRSGVKKIRITTECD